MDNENLCFKENTLCRICLTPSDELVYLFDKVYIEQYTETLDCLLLNCTSIKVSRNDDYPQFICKLCLVDLKNCYLFKQKCYKSLDQFKKYLQDLQIFASSVKSPQKVTFNNKDTTQSLVAVSSCSNENNFECNNSDVSYNEHFSNENQSYKIHDLKCACKNCEKVFLNEEDLHIHENEHSDITDELTCNICGKNFTRRSSVKRHMISHQGLKPYTCSFCHRSFTQSGTLSLHLRLHKEYKHLKKVKTNTQDNLHLCSICGSSFKQFSSLTIHLRRHSGDKPYSCKICQMRFISNSRLSSHSRIHTKERPYSCKYCQKNFSQSSSLNKHLKTHLNIKPYQCNYCAKLFSTSYYRNIHLRKHTGEKPLSCKVCYKSFSDPKNLKQHNAIHSGDKPFLCNTCGKKFRRIHHLKVHMSVHSKHL